MHIFKWCVLCAQGCVCFSQVELACAVAILLHSHSRASVKWLELMMPLKFFSPASPVAKDVMPSPWVAYCPSPHCNLFLPFCLFFMNMSHWALRKKKKKKRMQNSAHLYAVLRWKICFIKANCDKRQLKSSLWKRQPYSRCKVDMQSKNKKRLKILLKRWWAKKKNNLLMNFNISKTQYLFCTAPVPKALVL